MILHYTFDDIMCDVQYDAGTHINNEWFEPHYHKEPCEVEYKYKVTVSFQDFFDFMKPLDFRKWSDEKKDAYTQGLKDVFYSDWFDIDNLEDNDDFIDFMKDRYEEEAREQCQEEENEN